VIPTQPPRVAAITSVWALSPSSLARTAAGTRCSVPPRSSKRMSGVLCRRTGSTRFRCHGISSLLRPRILAIAPEPIGIVRSTISLSPPLSGSEPHSRTLRTLYVRSPLNRRVRSAPPSTLRLFRCGYGHQERGRHENNSLPFRRARRSCICRFDWERCSARPIIRAPQHGRGASACRSW
jgi:hypothetical protein